MKRVHAFEFEDLDWFPDLIRDYMTDYLQFITTKANLYKPVLPIFIEKLKVSGYKQVVDIASGAGGGWPSIIDEVQKEIPNIKVKFSDYYPNIKALNDLCTGRPKEFEFKSKSVNALDVPAHLKGFRTMFLSFHHFQPEDAKQILQNAVDSNAPIAIFEAQERSVANAIQFAFSPIFVWLTSLFIRPFKTGRLIFTYLIPIVPFFVGFDGVVSVLRTYSVEEMQTMASEVDPSGKFSWDIGVAREGQMKVQYLIGVPE